MANDSKVKGCTVWFTGLPSAGKTTLAKHLINQLKEKGIFRVELLDGDIVRTHLCKGLGFSKEDRDENIRRIGWVSEVLTKHGVVVVAAAISPYREIRDEVRKKIVNFVEVHVRCPVAVCEKRDVKGLYKLAREGKVQKLTGVDDPYEEPLNPEVVVETDKDNESACVEKILMKMKELHYIE